MSAASGSAKPTQLPRASTTTGSATAGTANAGLLSGSSSRYSLRGKPTTGASSSSSRASGATAAAREEAKRRMLELRTEVEGAVHVLDGGVNRTPLPLQRRQSLLGGVPHDLPGGVNGSMRLDMTQDSTASTALMNAELGTSFLHSSFMLNSSMRSSAQRQSMISMERDGGTQQQQQRSGRRGVENGSKSLESSMQSLSFANDRHLTDQSSSVFDSNAYRSGNAGGSSLTQRGSNASNPIPRLVQQNTLLTEAAYVKPPPMSAEKRAAWRKAVTTITLAETPTVFLYSHHDEAVSKEDAEAEAAVKARNAAYSAVEEAYRTDEGTRFHSTGVATMRAPLKSIQTEVHPPVKKDSGGLQVTPWMLKDAYVAALADMDDAEEEDNDDPQQQQQKDGANGGAGGGADVEDALKEEGGEENADGDIDDQSSDAAQSTIVSDEAGTTAPSAAATGAGGEGSGGAKAGVDAGKQWMLAETLLSTLRVMERAVVQNYVEAAQLAYRGIEMEPASQRVLPAPAGNGVPPPLPHSPVTAHTPLPPVSGEGSGTAANVAGNGAAAGAEMSDAAGLASATDREKADSADGGAALDGLEKSKAAAANAAAPPVRLSDDVRLLWRFGSSQLTRNRGVTCMTWNRRELDMLAVGYTACRSANARHNNGSRGNGSPPANQLGADVRDDGMLLKRSLGQEAYGMICCWSLKNPLAPELILFLRHEADVTALAFSNEHPSLLAVGSSTGEMVVYDIQRDVVFPSIASAVGSTSGQHTGAIWELQWVPKGKEQGEFLTSISADGRVVQWAVGKSIERVAPDLMHLQRQPGTQVEQAFVDGVAEAEAAAAAAQEAAAAASGKRGGKLQPRPPQKKSTTSTIAGVAGGGGHGGKDHHNGSGSGPAADDAVLSRQCGGMCFDVCPTDTAVYVVGTEDGSVLQCSKSQTETYDFEYASHAELVYRVRWSPYSAAYFLTCSADWTSRLYKVGTSKPQLRFNSVQQDAVQDVAWSPTNALIFATATARGSAEVWSVMDVMCPRASIEYEDHRHLSSVLFAVQETPVIVVGDEEGDVTVFLLEGECYSRQDLTDDEQEAWMAEAVRKQLT